MYKRAEYLTIRKRLETFKKMFNPHVALIVGDGGTNAEDFLTMDIRKLF